MTSKCTKEIIERVRPLVEAGVKWPQIATAVGVGTSTMQHWRQEGAATCEEDFAAMVKLAEEERETGKIKAGQFEQAQKHILVKVTKELRANGPKRPPSSYPKKLLLWYCDEVLDMILDQRMDLKEMWYHIDRRIEELTEEEMVVVKTEKAEVDPSQAAVKNVLTNAGEKAKRWTFKEEHEIDVTDKLSKLLTEIGSNRSVLPKQDEIEKYKEDDE